MKTFLLLVALSFCSTVSADPNFDLLAAIRSGEVAEVTMILEGGADLSHACMYAALVGRKDYVEYILSQGADINKPNPLSRGGAHTPLTAASYYGDSDMVRFLVSKGADVNTCNRDGLTALYIAAKKVNRKGGLGSHADIVRFLLKQGGNPALPDADEPLIIYAAGVANNRNLVRLLIEAGADLEVNAPHTALYWAARHGNEEIVKMLLEAGADS